MRRLRAGTKARHSSLIVVEPAPSARSLLRNARGEAEENAIEGAPDKTGGTGKWLLGVSYQALS